MDKIQQMRAFIQVVESGNFTRAAEALGLPRSTISTTVQALEDRLGAQLLQRTTRMVRPTQEGLQFLDLARDLVDAMAQAESVFRHRPEEISGRLRVDMPSRMSRRMVIPHLAEFCTIYPALQIDLSATDRMIDLIAEGVDVVVRLARLENSDLICRKLGDVPILTCASAGYVARHGMPQTPGDLTHHTLVNYALRMPAQTSDWDGTVAGKPVSVPMRSSLCVDNAESYVTAGLHGHGLIQVPALDVRDAIATGQLVELLADFRPAPIPISVLYARRRHLPPRARVFMDWLGHLLTREGFVA